MVALSISPEDANFPASLQQRHPKKLNKASHPDYRFNATVEEVTGHFTVLYSEAIVAEGNNK